VVSVLVLVAGISQLLIGPGRTGVTTDEPTQVERTQNWLSGGDFVPADLVGNTSTVGSEYVYGPAFSSLAHTVNAVAGNESWDAVSWSEASALNRHLTSAFLALITAAVAGLLIGFVTGSRMIGLWTAAALLAIPIWTGMGFFNPKDIPVATGYTFFTAALVLALRPGRQRWRPETSDIPIFALACFGVFLAVGSRLAMWLPLLLSLLVFAVLAAHTERTWGRPCRWPALLAGTGLAFVCLVALYPEAFGHPIEFVTRTLADSSDYSWVGVTLTAGKLLPAHPPWWYLPAWAFASIPLLLGLTALTGLGATAAGLWRSVRSGTLRTQPVGLRKAAALLVLAQMLILPLASVVNGSTMYSGLRQHLYLVPAVAMLAGLGAAWLLGWNRGRRPSPLRTWLLTGGLALALIFPTVEQMMLFPYNYIYVNPIAGINGIDDRWEGDYWFASKKEAAEKVPEGEVRYCGVVYPDRDFDPAALRPCERRYIPDPGQPRNPDPASPGQRWTLLERRGGAVLPAECSPVSAVTRQLRSETVVISYLARC
jgi:hypothetical protein